MNSREALDRLYDACDKMLLYEQCCMEGYDLYEIIRRDLEQLETYDKDGKDIPRRIVWLEDSDGRPTINCPNCKKVFATFYSEVETVPIRERCSECGQLIDWDY